MIFSQDGEIQAVVVESTVSAYGYGAYAYPFNGYGVGWGWNPYSRVYTLPYGANQIGAMQPFQYHMFNGFWY